MATSVLSITTQSQMAAAPNAPPGSPPWPWIWLYAALFASALVLMRHRSAPARRLRFAAVALLLLATIAVQTACNGGGPARVPPGTYSIPINATSGNTTRTTTLTLIVR